MKDPRRALDKRRFAVSDIHGCSKTLRKLVEGILQLKPGDTLYLLGDLIDRGQDSKGVLDYLLHLLEAGFDIRPIQGNHEEMLLNAVVDPSACAIWFNNGGWQTMREFEVNTPGAIPQRYIDFLASLPLMYLLDDYLLVHAGLDFRKDEPITESTPQDLLWLRDYRVDPVKIGGRTLVTGHTVTPLFEIKASLNTHHIRLDNCCYDKGEICCGNLVALNLNTRELLVQRNVE